MTLKTKTILAEISAMPIIKTPYCWVMHTAKRSFLVPSLEYIKLPNSIFS